MGSKRVGQVRFRAISGDHAGAATPHEALEGKSTAMKMTQQRSRIAASATEMRDAVKAARQRERTATKIKDARYDRKSDTIIAFLSTGATLTVPRRAIPGFAKASPRKLGDVAITPGAEGIWSDAVDDGVLLEQLLVLAAGETTLGTIGARINAAKKTPARARASRANGAKGGRPRKTAV